eukprot:TRINITY_DN68433_c0_g1_i1.p1 TRINITY_DN68433_c0_g1~~TRINITY_DN68433_c0_g1_i1.p1  ORF type:complete len:405 (-),score=49.07 TRINITY_DN68433_c0_g1_i1:251-1423(-)
MATSYAAIIVPKPPEMVIHDEQANALVTCISSSLHETIEMKRERFEGRADFEAMRKHQSLVRAGRGGMHREADELLKTLRVRGDGNVALAWRRYFDNDGDGKLSFREFCKGLSAMQFEGNVSRLWIDLGGSISNSLSLHALDPENAAVLEIFGRWCAHARGGPIEVFTAIDTDGCDSLTKDEFVTGLRRLGFFQADNLPKSLATEEQVLANLIPLLGQADNGCVTPHELLFLERDKQKREHFGKELKRIREYGKAPAAGQPVRNSAQRMLGKLAVKTTVLGGMHWKSLNSHNPAVAARGSRLVSPKRGVRGNFQRRMTRCRTMPSGVIHLPSRSASDPSSPVCELPRNSLVPPPAKTPPMLPLIEDSLWAIPSPASRRSRTKTELGFDRE